MKRLLFGCLAILAALTFSSAGNKGNLPGKRYAICVGIDKYADRSFVSLKYACDDAKAISKTLKEKCKYDFTMTMTTDIDYTESNFPYRQNILKNIATLSEHVMKPQDSVVFFFSGHGIADAGGQGYLLPVEASSDGEKIFETAIAIEDIVKSFKKNGISQVVMMIDACRESVSDKKGLSVRGVQGATASEAAIMFATKPGSFSYEDPDGKNGIFTRFLLEGLSGKADENKDGVVTLLELSTYVHDQVVLYSLQKGKDQCPVSSIPDADLASLLILGPEGQVALALENRPDYKPPVTPAPTPQALALGTVNVSTKAPGELFIGEASKGAIDKGVSKSITGLKPGDTVLTMKYKDGTTESVTVKVAAGLSVEAVFQHAELSVPMIRTEGGTFFMGSSSVEKYRGSDEIRHKVSLKAFRIAKYELTVGEFKAFATEAAYKTTAELENSTYTWLKPGFVTTETTAVACISWYDAIAYCNWLSVKSGLTPAYSMSGKTEFAKWPKSWNRESDSVIKCDWAANGYRLPTEAEWEFACRAGTTTPFSLGESLGFENANFNATEPYGEGKEGPASKGPKPVGSYAANPLGLFDMHGNVAEWCWDWYGDLSSAAQTDPKGPTSGEKKVLRGGAWNRFSSVLRSAAREEVSPMNRPTSAGFRLAMNG